MSPAIPSTIGRYLILRRLGAGGMGTVFLARDPDLDRQVAIKLVKDDLSGEPDLRARFSREARAAARLSHPNIITIFDIGEDQGRPFIAMEYVLGESLADVIRRQALLTLDQILGYMQALCEGLAHAHRAGVVHRDVKPANVLVGLDGTVKIVDFGIARLANTQATRDGVLMGTLNYMSPEQVQGRGVDARSDQFAVGCVFYEVLTFTPAFAGSVVNGLMSRIISDEPPSLAQLLPDLPRDVVAIVETALRKDPERRFPDLSVMAKEVADARAAASLSGSYQDWVTGRFDTSDLIAAKQAAASGRPGAVPGIRPAGWGIQEPPRAAQADSAGVVETPAEADRRAAAEPDLARAALAVEAPEAVLEDRHNELETARAGQMVEQAQRLAAGGRSEDALAQVAGIQASSDAIAASLREIRDKAGEGRRQRQVELFLDAAELAVGLGEFAHALSLVADAAHVDPAAPRVEALRRQAEAAQKAAGERERRRQELLDAVARALDQRDLAAAKAQIEQVLALHPADEDGRARALRDRLRQAEEAAAEAARQAAPAAQEADRLARGRGWWLVVILVVLALLGSAAAAVSYYVFFR